ncbi:hypothetical protein [Pseudonocardia alaniniphila]|uniref:Uncharacterized protein n=1 Tax=Pseudonocardia alaniniphila TaxID=75291 RepID=A0ABS9TUP3_9PSEU|nr:hypothetical protein [Pseudonocardia alaniniphila]MCH6172249.1 hypothetical protein [Pseudonocardia alaniniphila]
MSSPALHRYVDGKAGPVRALYEDLTAELIDAAVAAARHQDPDDISPRLRAATRAVVSRAVADRAEFGLLTGASSWTTCSPHSAWSAARGCAERAHHATGVQVRDLPITPGALPG